MAGSHKEPAYPRFKRLLSARELHVFYTPQPDEVAWAREWSGSDEHLLALVVMLKWTESVVGALDRFAR